MSNQSIQPAPHFHSSQYGFVNFEGEIIPCAFGGEPGGLTAFIPIPGICQIIGISVEGEIARIQHNHLLATGLFMVPFSVSSANGKHEIREYPSITLTRLHTWLALIPPNTVPDERMRDKLVSMQNELTDVIYAYFGRPLLPQEIRAEDDRYLDRGRKEIYDRLEEAHQLANRVGGIEEEIEALKGKVNKLLITISAGEESDYISADQQEQISSIVNILARRYEDKHGKGSRGALIKSLQDQHNWRYYNMIAKKTWAPLIRDCVQQFRQLNPPGTPLPQVFQIALRSMEQDKLI